MLKVTKNQFQLKKKKKNSDTTNNIFTIILQQNLGSKLLLTFIIDITFFSIIKSLIPSFYCKIIIKLLCICFILNFIKL